MRRCAPKSSTPSISAHPDRDLEHGQRCRIKARSRRTCACFPGDRTGLKLRPGHLSLFDKASGRALRTALHDGGARG
jgi:hypothetical protein